MPQRLLPSRRGGLRPGQGEEAVGVDLISIKADRPRSGTFYRWSHFAGGFNSTIGRLLFLTGFLAVAIGLTCDGNMEQRRGRQRSTRRLRAIATQGRGV
jgi:hypothetical protein